MDRNAYFSPFGTPREDKLLYHRVLPKHYRALPVPWPSEPRRVRVVDDFFFVALFGLLFRRLAS